MKQHGSSLSWSDESSHQRRQNIGGSTPCAVGVTNAGEKDFLAFIFGGQESQVSWRKFLSDSKKGTERGKPQTCHVDSNPGPLAALRTCLLDAPVQPYTEHKLQGITHHCPRAIQPSVLAGVKKRSMLPVKKSHRKSLPEPMKERSKSQ
ncbi:hypothetical protein ES707_03266 [subsurface metagenome]